METARYCIYAYEGDQRRYIQGDYSVKYGEMHFLARLRDDRSRLPEFLGATLRGALGYILKRTVCQVAHGDCNRCLLSSACPYPLVFEGLPSPDRELMRKYPRIPQPFVLLPHLPSPDEQHIAWGIRLFGSATRYWPYVAHVFREACDQGLGRNKVVCDIVSITDASNDVIVWDPAAEVSRDLSLSPSPSRLMTTTERCTLRWRFVTPVQIVVGGSGVGTRVNGLDIVLAGRRRVDLMRAFYGNGAIERPEQPRFEATDFITRRNTLRHWQISRFSGRQERSVELHGSMGEIEIDGPWAQVGDWLSDIETVHLGKSVSFGLGAVTWEIV